MRVVIAGMGVQGRKRKEICGPDFVAFVDPHVDGVPYKSILDVPLDSYDAVLACIPDEPKLELLQYCLSNGKHVLVEKPLVSTASGFVRLMELARTHKAVCYTAYNHRFEPHFVRMRELIQSGVLGKIYSCRMFYGNGTARLVRDSAWRDNGAGVLPDLGSHLVDTCAFWFGDVVREAPWSIVSANRFENRSPDHVAVQLQRPDFRIELEMTLLMWRNHFTCDILAERGSAHIESLCKWGPSTFIHRTRILPSGRPTETQLTLTQPDPTWAAEYAYFKQRVEQGHITNLEWDSALMDILAGLEAKIV